MDMDDASLTRWLVAVRAVHFGCCLLIGGTWTVDRLAIPWPAWRRMAARLLWVATPLALMSGAAWLVLVAADMSGTTVAEAVRPAVLGTVWNDTQFGRAWQVHAACWAAGAVVAGVWARTGRGRWIGSIAAAGLVGSLAWAGHGATGPAPAVHRVADVLHLLTAAVWPGGLLPFALLLRSVVRSVDVDRRTMAVRVTRRFSAASLTAVGLLTATGLVDGYCLLGSIGALVTTPYGRVLAVKLALFAGMVALGAANLLVLKPRLPTGVTAVRQLGRSVAVEIVLGTGVVVAVGLLGILEPPRM